MIDGKQPIYSKHKTYENIRKISTGVGDDYMIGCFLDYSYFKENYKLIAIDLSKQQALDADPKAIQQIHFTVNFDRAGNTTIICIIKEAKETVLAFSQRTYNSIQWFNFYQYKMTQYSSLNVKLSDSQLNKLKSAIKNETEVVLNLSLNMTGDDETNFPHKLLLTNRQVAKSFS